VWIWKAETEGPDIDGTVANKKRSSSVCIIYATVNLHYHIFYSGEFVLFIPVASFIFMFLRSADELEMKLRRVSGLEVASCE